jgi:hypothetical protein
MAYKRMGTLTGFKGSEQAGGSKAGWCAKDSLGGSKTLVDSIDADPEFACDFFGLEAGHNEAQHLALRLGQPFNSVVIARRHKNGRAPLAPRRTCT